MGFCLGGFAGEPAALLLNLCMVWRINGRFPRKLADFKLENYLQKLTDKRESSKVKA